jgi:menaquinone-dependent protoporphyrinogen oxidase
MPVLVAYASRHGSTQGIAGRIAAVLRASGLGADLAAAEDAGDPAGYDAFVIGSAAYASGLDDPGVGVHPAQRCAPVRPPGVAVQRRPGRAADPASGDAAPGPGRSRRSGPRPGPSRLPGRGRCQQAPRRGAPDQAVLAQGDFRDWPDIEAGATGIASGLRRTRPPHAP